MLNTSMHDHFHVDYRLYLDGIEVPFESAYISQTYREAPSASITMPPWPGLQDIGRNYSPKVHIFWRDPSFGITPEDVGPDITTSDLRELNRESYKLIFSGEVKGTSDSKEISPGGGGQSITLQCSHDSEVLKDILIRFVNAQVEETLQTVDPLADGSVRTSNWTPSTLIMRALNGVTDTTDIDDDTNVPEGCWDKLKGTPGILRVLWNILSNDARRDQGTSNNSQAMLEMYTPLVEEGMKFWHKMSGHTIIEEGIHSKRAKVPNTAPKRGIDPNRPDTAMIPSAYRTFISETVQIAMSNSVMSAVSQGGGSPETENFFSIMDEILTKLEYEMLTLASPISKADGTSVEYIVKPTLAYYYAPICNVVLPNMVTSVSVSNNYATTPTRVVNLNNVTSLVTGLENAGPSLQFTAPHSVRYARAGGDGGTLKGSMGAYNNNVGIYEWGTGIRSRTCQLPTIYNVMQAGVTAKERKKNTIEIIDRESMERASAAWLLEYPNSKWPGVSSYNLWDPDSGIGSADRMNFMFADHDYSLSLAKSRSASVSGVFNPYAIPGYPMDVVDPVPSRESYHGMCTSVTHTIHSSGTSSTNYSLVAVNSFSELALFNIPSVNPYLMSTLDLVDDPRIYKNETGYLKACELYLDLLGIGAAEPAILQDYYTGTPIPFTRATDSGCWTTERDDGLYQSTRGSLLLVSRNIVSLNEVEEETSNKFIDMSDWMYTDSNDVSFVPNAMRVEIEPSDTKILIPGIDVESSPFLEYKYDVKK